MLDVTIKSYQLHFKQPSGTSRGVLRSKNGWFITLGDRKGQYGIGECSIIEGLSPDKMPELQKAMDELVNQPDHFIAQFESKTKELPALRFAIECALQDLNQGGQRLLYPSSFTDGEKGICINGLIWMGEKSFMFEQIKEKINAGFRCIKLKIGAIDFKQELDLLQFIRSQFSKEDIELRVDANGAFDPKMAMDQLQLLAQFDLHSIEQPIGVSHIEDMAKLCENTPLPIALDEQLIGVYTQSERKQLLTTIKPQYIILKPSLIGGFTSSDQWIDLAESMKIGWWATSALESNIGLNAIAQWSAIKETVMPQGLGTGQLYTNNIESPLQIKGEFLYYLRDTTWQLKEILN